MSKRSEDAEARIVESDVDICLYAADLIDKYTTSTVGAELKIVATRIRARATTDTTETSGGSSDSLGGGGGSSGGGGGGSDF